MNSTLVTFAGHLADVPELRFTPLSRGFVASEVVVARNRSGGARSAAYFCASVRELRVARAWWSSTAV